MTTTPASFNPITLALAYLHAHWVVVGPAIAVCAYLVAEALLKSSSRVKANSPVEAVANLLVTLLPKWFPVVARVASALATPEQPTLQQTATTAAKASPSGSGGATAALLLVIAVGASGCAYSDAIAFGHAHSDAIACGGTFLGMLLLAVAIVLRKVRRIEHLAVVAGVVFAHGARADQPVLSAQTVELHAPTVHITTTTVPQADCATRAAEATAACSRAADAVAQIVKGVATPSALTPADKRALAITGSVLGMISGLVLNGAVSYLALQQATGKP